MTQFNDNLLFILSTMYFAVVLNTPMLMSDPELTVKKENVAFFHQVTHDFPSICFFERFQQFE